MKNDIASPSSRRAWIEIGECAPDLQRPGSPSSRRAWIEIIVRRAARLAARVALLAEGVDRNCTSLTHWTN